MFGKKKTPDQLMREQDRQLKRVQRDLGRDRGKMEREEKKLELEIKKAAKEGNKAACAVLAKQLVNLRKQKTRTYTASAQIGAVGMQAKSMNANMKVATAMGKTTKTMANVNKQMDAKKMSQTMQQFQRENMKMEMSEEMINDVMDDIFDESDDEQEQDAIVNQVLGEIGIELTGKMNTLNMPANKLGGTSQADQEVEDIEAKLNNLRATN